MDTCQLTVTVKRYVSREGEANQPSHGNSLSGVLYRLENWCL